MFDRDLQFIFKTSLILFLIKNFLINLSLADSKSNLSQSKSDSFYKMDKKNSEKSKPQWRIINGAHAEPGLFPWQLQLQRNFRKHCGATLIKPNWAVTAAHCVSDTERMDIMAGSTHWNGGSRITVAKTVIHPEYDRRRFLNDIALLKLSRSPITESENYQTNDYPSSSSFISSSSPSDSLIFPNSNLMNDQKSVFENSGSLYQPSSSLSQSTNLFPSSSLFNDQSSDFFNNFQSDTKNTKDSFSNFAFTKTNNGQSSVWDNIKIDDKDMSDENSNFFFSFKNKKKANSRKDWIFDEVKENLNSSDDDKIKNENFFRSRKKKRIIRNDAYKSRFRNKNIKFNNNSALNFDDLDEKKINQINLFKDSNMKLGIKSKNKEQKFRSNDFHVDSIKLPEYFMQFKGTATVVGWGLISESDRIGTEHLMAANVRILENNHCKNYKNFEYESQICAGYPNGGVDACAGDSGGGLVTMVKDSPFLIGVVSYGLGCGRKNFPGVYTKVSHYKDWIETVTTF